MSILKKKVQLYQASKTPEKASADSKTFEEAPIVKVEAKNSDSPQTEEYLLPTRKPRQNKPCPEGNSKNIVKNYGKVLCAFASSTLAVPYLERIVEKKYKGLVDINEFMNHIKEKKERTASIESIRNLLVETAQDTNEEIIYKQLFKETSIIFLKYFCVNWIYSGRLLHKNAHLKFRFRMLRRVQNPEHFTYLKTTFHN